MHPSENPLYDGAQLGKILTVMSCDDYIKLKTKNTVIELQFSDLYVSSLQIMTKNVSNVQAMFQQGD